VETLAENGFLCYPRRVAGYMAWAAREKVRTILEIEVEH
jgi:hypothetical protein